MPETKVETIHCGFCGGSVPLDEWNEHWDTCEKRLAHPSFKKVEAPLMIETNEKLTPEEFLARIDEEEIEVPRGDREPAAAAPLIPVNPGEEAPVEGPDEIIDEEKAWLIRNKTFVEVDGKVETPEQVVKEESDEEAEADE